MTLNKAYAHAKLANHISHRAYVVCSGIDPHGLYYHFVEADEYSKSRDGRIVATIN